MDILAGWIRTQSNTQFQFQGGVSKVIYRTSYDPIQYLIPIQGYPFKGKYFWRTYMMDELGHNLPGKHWPHPIPNSNTWVPILNNIFDWHMYMLDELTPNPIPNSNSWVGYRNQSAGRAMTQSNTQFQYKGTHTEQYFWLSYVHVGWTQTQSNTQSNSRVGYQN